MSPFDAYDHIRIPSGKVGTVYLYPEYPNMSTVPKGSVFVHCGYELEHMDIRYEKLVQIIYLYPAENREPYYVISTRR
jgi:hypothetical protein